MRIPSLALILFSLCLAHAQTVPTFQFATYTVVGSDPGKSGTTIIPVVLVPVALSFDSHKSVLMDAAADVPHILRSPVFANFAFPSGGNTQYADAMLRNTFPKANDWHTLLGK